MGKKSHIFASGALLFLFCFVISIFPGIHGILLIQPLIQCHLSLSLTNKPGSESNDYIPRLLRLQSYIWCIYIRYCYLRSFYFKLVYVHSRRLATAPLCYSLNFKRNSGTNVSCSYHLFLRGSHSFLLYSQVKVNWFNSNW